MDRRKNKLKSRSGLTMVELLIALIISAILLMAVGVLSQISITTQRKYTDEMQIHADISYGFKKLRKRVREYGFVKDDTVVSPWLGGARLVVGNSAFGIYANTNSNDFVYVPNISDEANREVILSVPNSETPPNLTLTPEATVPPRTVTIRVDGQKNGVAFDMSTTVTKRGS